MSTSQQARIYLAEQMHIYPELFPAIMAEGYKFNGWTEVSKKMENLQLRRIRLSKEDADGRKLAYTIAPCDVLPYMTGMVSDVEKIEPQLANHPIVEWLCQLGNGKGKITHHFFLEGLKNLLIHFSFP